jgi:hypothetical protein
VADWLRNGKCTASLLTLESHRLLDGVHILRLGLVHRDLPLLVSRNESRGLDDRARLERPDRHRGEQRGEEEVVAGGNDNDVVLLRVEVLEERGGAPAGTKHDKRRLRRVGSELVGRVRGGLRHWGEVRPGSSK